MKLSKAILSLSVALSFLGCRSTGSNSDASSMPPGALGLPQIPRVVYLDGDNAKTVYSKINLTEVATNNGHQKAVAGEYAITCTKTPPGALPPGALGKPSPTTYACTIFPIVHFPAGVQGKVAQTLGLNGSAAQAFYEAFNVDEKPAEDSPYKVFTGHVNILASSFDGDSGSDATYRFTITSTPAN